VSTESGFNWHHWQLLDKMTERYRAIQVSRSDNRIVLRFVSPKTRNALSTNVLTELERFVTDCESDSLISEIIFTGTDDVFASGADLREIRAITSNLAVAFAGRGQSLMTRIERLKVPTIAAVNGICYGGGLDLALACKRRIAKSTASFCHPGVGLGIITGWGGTQRLPRLVGAAAASEMFFTAQPISAEGALTIGLVDTVNDELFEKI
jgi:enoyl-CoA hydratase